MKMLGITGLSFMVAPSSLTAALAASSTGAFCLSVSAHGTVAVGAVGAVGAVSAVGAVGAVSLNLNPA